MSTTLQDHIHEAHASTHDREMRLRAAWAYAAVVVPSVALIVWILRAGGPDVAVAVPASAVPDGAIDGFWRAVASSPLATISVQILIVLLAARLCNVLLVRLRQPAVIGQIVAGIVLGPSVLGALWPAAEARVFPPESIGALQLLTQVGVMLYMFGVGMEIRWTTVRRQAHVSVLLSHMSILVPLLLGVLLAIPLFDRYAPAGIGFPAFALFIGVAMSITAFPVLARILEERRLARTELGGMALTCAAVDDVSAWILLAVVVAMVSGTGTWVSTGRTLAILVLLVAVMALIVRPWLERRFQRAGGNGRGLDVHAATTAIAVLLASALVTEVAGVHALFGAFLAGALMPLGDEARASMRERIDGLAAVVLLPLFFASTGLRTNLGLLTDGASWLALTAIVAVAVTGKLAGSIVAARLMRVGWRDALILGALMNSRGLMELVALNVALDVGLISRDLFTCFVVMALVTTAMTGPAIDLVLCRGVGAHDLVARRVGEAA